MKYLFITSLFTVMLTCSFSSCTGNREKKETLSSKDIVVDSNAVLTYTELDTFNNDTNKIEKLLDLPSLKETQNDSEIRIWFEYAHSDSGKLIILKSEHNNWISHAIYYKMKFDEMYKIVSVSKKEETNEPNSGWKNFIRKINGLGIYDLKNYKEISGYSVCADGDPLTIEVKKDGKYKLLQYPCWEVYVIEDPLAEIIKIKEICLLIQKEFGYKLFPRPHSASVLDQIK